MQKIEIRQQLRKQRKHYPAVLQQQVAVHIMHRVKHLTIFLTSQHIAGYLAYQGEIDTLPLLKYSWQVGKKCYLPVVDEIQTSSLHFVSYEPDDSLHPNRYHILEPEYSVEKATTAGNLDLVLVPLVGFDQYGNRLGSGQGYYDRTFAFLNQTQRLAKPFLLGLAYSWQQVEKIPCDSWDVKLNGVVTEKEALLFI